MKDNGVFIPQSETQGNRFLAPFVSIIKRGRQDPIESHTNAAGKAAESIREKLAAQQVFPALDTGSHGQRVFDATELSDTTVFGILGAFPRR